MPSSHINSSTPLPRAQIVIVANGIVGARLHTPFAITSRAAFGYQLSKFAVVSRMVIAWFWLSVNTYQGTHRVVPLLFGSSLITLLQAVRSSNTC